MRYTYRTKGTCSSAIQFNLDGNVVTDIEFFGGCDGNLKAVAKLVNGWTVEQIENALKGNTCGWKRTSCADQLALAVREALDKSSNA